MPGTEAAAGDDSAAQLRGIEEDPIPRSGGLEGGQLGGIRAVSAAHRAAIVEKNALGAAHPLQRLVSQPRHEGRLVAARPEDLDLEIPRFHPLRAFGNGQ